MARKKSKKSKDKKRKYISKISRDGKISKKEGQKAAKKGISLRKIQNRRVGDYRQASRDFDKNRRVRARNPGAERPSYEPLKIKRGAEQADRRRQESKRRPEPKRRSSPTKKRSSPEQRTKPTLDQTVRAPQVEFTPFEPVMPDFQGMMDRQAAQYQSQLDSMRAEQEASAAEYRRQAEEQRKQFELQQRTMIGNEARAGQQAEFQLGGKPGMKRGGTFGFRRRRSNMMSGIAAAAGSMLNI